MRVLVIGGGGREHAVSWKLSQSNLVDKIYCSPGNAGTYLESKCENVILKSNKEMLDFALENKIDLTFVGPEVPLIDGIVNMFNEKGLMIIGPDKEAAQLEGSKEFSKKFMDKYGVKTAEYRVFEDVLKAGQYLDKCSFPIVIKADGLAAGKGVVICNSIEEAKETLKEFMLDDIFHGAGKKILIEEYLVGVEASILSITDGNTIIPFISAKDHKQIFDSGVGPNTGGMGAIAPNPYCSQEVLEIFKKDIMLPTLHGIKSEKMHYKGIIFFGVMITKKGIYLLEYNVRMGDPETQAIMPLLKSDFMEILLSTCRGKLNECEIKWKDDYSCCVIASSKGYPGLYEKNKIIKGIENTFNKVFISGAINDNRNVLTNGGRVLSASGLADSMEAARKAAYEDINKIMFDGIYFRKDIGKIE